MRSVYKCFGFELARNGNWQEAMPMVKVDMKNMCSEERIKFLDALPVGTIMNFPGHVIMYLGKSNGKYYVISSTGSIMQPEDPSVRQRVRSTIINTLDIKRSNGNTWFDELTVAMVPFYDEADELLPDYEWYHDGVVYCLKNKIMKGDENKFFNPDKVVTWSEFLQVLYNTDGTKLEIEEGANLSDEIVNWAKDGGFICETDKEFKPEDPITREMVASVLYLYAKAKGYDVSMGEDTNILSYDDAFDIGECDIPAMQYVVGAGVISGKTISALNPKDNITRGEVAVIIERFAKHKPSAQ